MLVPNAVNGLGPECRSRRSGAGSWGAAVAAALGALAFATPSAALDEPISGRLVKLKSSATGTQLVFASDDPAVPFPAIGGSDDPASGTPGGISVEIFTRSGASDLASAPAGLGNPGWSVDQYGVATYRYRNGGGTGISRLRMVTLSQGRRLRVRGVSAIGLGAPLGAVAIRVTTGSLRSCAVFDGASVRRDLVGRFLARDASAPAVADCDDVTLLTALGLSCDSAPGTCGGVCPGDGVCAPYPVSSECRCVFPTQPCGETAPVCGGECPAGEQCYPTDNFIPGPINGCACAPIGEPPCGATGFACSATPCPGGLVCDLIPGPSGFYDSQCSCVDPNAVCGQPGYGECPPDFECLFFPPGAGGDWGCVPDFCGGTYPACGGPCASGSNCVPLEITGGAQFCVCATPGLSCDDGAICDGGFNCPPGEVCTLAGSPLGSSCSCEPP